MTSIQETISIQQLNSTFSRNNKKFPENLINYKKISDYSPLNLPSSGQTRNNTSLTPTMNYPITDIPVRFEPSHLITNIGFKFLYDPTNENIRSFALFYNNDGNTATTVDVTISLFSSPQYNATSPWYITLYKNNDVNASTQYTTPYYIFFLQSDTNNNSNTIVLKYNIFPPDQRVTGYYSYYDSTNDINVVVTDNNYRSVYQIVNYTNSSDSLIGFEKGSGGPFISGSANIADNFILTAYFNNQSPGFYSNGVQLHNLISGGEPHIRPIYGDEYLLQNM